MRIVHYSWHPLFTQRYFLTPGINTGHISWLLMIQWDCLVIRDITVVNCLHCFRYNYIGKFEISRSLSHILYILWVSTCLFMYPISFPPPTTKPCKQQKEFRILKIQKQDVKKLIIQKILNIIKILIIYNFSYY